MKPRIQIDTSPVANHYAGGNERIVEFSSPNGGGLISFTMIDGTLIVDVYGTDDTVKVRGER